MMEELMRKFQEQQAANDPERKKAAERKRLIEESATLRKEREKDMAEGRKRGAKEFADGSLGRVEAQRGDEVGDLIARRKANLEGYSPEEENALRDSAMAGVDRAGQTSLRMVKGIQGATGLRGGLAAAQQVGVAKDLARAKAGVEQNVFLDKIKQRRAALDSFETSVGNARTDELNRQKYNIEQGNKEKFARIGTEFGYAGFGQNERSSVLQNIIGEKTAAAQVEAAQKSGKK